MADENVVPLNIEKMICDISTDAAADPAIQQPFSIFRVPAHIRSYKNNDRYLEPRVVSIGPYHRNKDHLCAMEKHKQRYFDNFLEKSGRITREEYFNKIRKLLPSIRNCYFESINDLKDKELFQIMLLDGCFILQLLIKLHNLKNMHDLTNDPVFRVGWNLPLMSTDLLMLENQIPFSVLEILYEMYSYGESSQTRKPSLDDLLLNFVKRVEHRRKEEVVINYKKWLVRKKKAPATDLWKYQIHHLLHFYYIAYNPVLESTNSPKCPNIIFRALSSLSFMTRRRRENCHPEEANLRGETRPSEDTHPQGENYPLGEIPASEHIDHSREIRHVEHTQSEKVIDISQDIHQMEEEIRQLEETQLKETDSLKITSYPRMIPCATELQEFGITFKRHEHPKNFLDISFLGGVLKIPCIAIEEATKSKFMNLVAFEQTSGIDNKHMTSYALFMDFLLNTGKDVIVLQRDNIIENKLANEDEVAEFFSQLHGCCYIKFDKHYLAPVFRDIKAYCESFWPKHRAKLHRDYLSNPWAIISFGAALLVICITIFRTICFILSVFFHYPLRG